MQNIYIQLLFKKCDQAFKNFEEIKSKKQGKYNKCSKSFTVKINVLVL